MACHGPNSSTISYFTHCSLGPYTLVQLAQRPGRHYCGPYLWQVSLTLLLIRSDIPRLVTDITSGVRGPPCAPWDPPCTFCVCPLSTSSALGSLAHASRAITFLPSVKGNPRRTSENDAGGHFSGLGAGGCARSDSLLVRRPLCSSLPGASVCNSGSSTSPLGVGGPRGPATWPLLAWFCQCPCHLFPYALLTPWQAAFRKFFDDLSWSFTKFLL